MDKELQLHSFIQDLCWTMRNWDEEILKLYNEMVSLEKLLSVNKRREIYDIVRTQQINIRELSHKIDLSYQNTFEHVKLLKKKNLIKSDKNGRDVILSKNSSIEEEIQKLRTKQLKALEKNFTQLQSKLQRLIKNN